MKYAKHIIAASIATLIVGCSSESEPAPENQRPTITLPEGSTYDVSEGGAVTVEFDVQDEGAVSVAALTNSGEIKGNVSIGSGALTYTAPWIDDGNDIVETISLVATDSEGLKSSVTITFNVSDGTSSALVVISPPSEAFGFENTREDTVVNFWIYENQPGVVLSYEISDEDADSITLDYDVDSDNYLYRNQITPSLNSDNTKAELSFDLPATNKPYENATVELSVDDGDDVRRVYANMTVINQPDLKWNNPGSTISESTGASIPFVMNESIDQGGDYQVSVTYPDGSELDFDLPYSFSESDNRIDFFASDGFLGDRSVTVTLTYTMLIPNAAGEIHEHVTQLSRDMLVKDDRDDDFLSLNSRIQNARVAFEQLSNRNDDGMVLTALNDRLQFKGIINGNQRARLSEIINSAQSENRNMVSTAFDEIEDAVNDDVDNEALTLLVENAEHLVGNFGSLTREKYIEAFNEMETTGAVSLRLPDSSAPADISAFWVSHYYGNSRYGAFESESFDSFQFYPRYAYMNVTHLDLSDCTTS